jgi:hypothetical protein
MLRRIIPKKNVKLSPALAVARNKKSILFSIAKQQIAGVRQITAFS